MQLKDEYYVKRVTNIQENKQMLTTSAQINPDITLAPDNVTISNTNIKRHAQTNMK